MASKINKGEILAKFFDDGEYTALFADGAVSAACGYAAGQQAYAVYQNGEAVSVKDVEKNIKVLEMAAQTGCPVVTFYNSVGAKLAEGLDVLTASAKLNAQIAKVSGVIPQVAVVLGVCGGTSALSAANADVCIMAEGAELFFTAPFTSAAKGDKVPGAGTAEAAAKAGAATFMTSFNDNDGVPSTGNTFILKDVLRGEWGFDGVVVSDWASVAEMIAHGFAPDSKEAAMKAVNAGVDMEMVSYTFVKELPELIKEGKVKESAIDDAVRNILRVKYRLGLFDNPYVDEKRIEELYAPAHLEAAKQAAVESAILLKNEKETLPLQSSVKTVAVVGPMANAPYDQLGTWIFDGDKTKTVTPLKAIKELVGDKVQVIYEPGLTYSRDKNMAGVAKAAAAAVRADVILAFVGEEAILSGEAHCLADLNLQGAQSELIAALAKTGKPVVTVVMAGRPLTIGKEVELSSAVLYSFHPGTMGGPALADLLWGKAVPSGKTPVTFPKMVGQIPVYYAHNSSGRPATRNEVLLNDIPLEAGQTSLGCTSFYMDAGFDPLYPFGYGLSYTTFKYDNVKLSSANLKKEDVLTVTFDLENTGKYEGTEVAQLYVQDKFASVTRPVKELKRFARVTLKPGEKKNVSFELPISELAFWNIDMVKTVEAGDFALWVAPDSQSGEEVFFRVVD